MEMYEPEAGKGQICPEPPPRVRERVGVCEGVGGGGVGGEYIEV